MKLAPGVRAVVAFPRPCCGDTAHCGKIVVVDSLTTMAEAARSADPFMFIPIVECGICKAPVSPDLIVARVVADVSLLLHACRLLPLPPDDEASKLFGAEPKPQSKGRILDRLYDALDRAYKRD